MIGWGWGAGGREEAKGDAPSAQTKKMSNEITIKTAKQN
jgi:hypothetical protein